KILTYPERTYFHNRFGRHDYDLDLAAQFLAGRFAAKEACRKACDHLDKNTRGFKHIVILPVTELDRTEHQSRRPEALVLWEALKDPERSTAAQESLNVQTLEGQLCEISISHDGDYASAVALVPGMKQNQL
ncbi:hypothetical protein C7974DRAFT_291849, partial [Boeremia exigua]|uniref:uncharacterized protein n=1 Tax=Boeremia exigua TaxID=749465 RepID=UPI001E8ED3D7